MTSKTGFCDFHCHLDDDSFADNRWQIIEHCFLSGLDRIITVADPFKKTSLTLSEELLSRYPEIYAVCGAHPHQADQYSREVEKGIIDFVKKEKMVAIGEVGLDFHYDFASRENQRTSFKRQIALARDLNLPLVIHSRNAESEVLTMLNNEKFDLPVVFHCFTGNKQTAAEIIRRGYGISLSGIITFKKADALREIVKMIPLDQLFSETDAPYLAPEPKRGETNNPLGVIPVVKKIAMIKETSEEQIKDAISQNVIRLITRN